MHSSFEKPHQHHERSREYQSHLRRINEIVKGKQKSKRNSSLGHYPKSNKSQYDRLYYQRISQQNSKLAQRIIGIVSKKHSREWSPPINLSTSNKRLEEKKRIFLENVQLAERLVAKHSDLQIRKSKMMKDISEYQNIRRSMIRNRRVLAPSHSSRSESYTKPL